MYYNYRKERIKNLIIIAIILSVAIISTHYIYYKFKDELVDLEISKGRYSKEYFEKKIAFDKWQLKNRERWIRVPMSESVRGYRYYKIKVDNNIDRKFLEQIILPCCAHYCCSFEWI